MEKQKKQSSLTFWWSWGKAHHGKLIVSIIPGDPRRACQMIPYLWCFSMLLRNCSAGETTFSVSIPACMSRGFDRILRERYFFQTQVKQ